jgi:hypothetical protein
MRPRNMAPQRPSTTVGSGGGERLRATGSSAAANKGVFARMMDGLAAEAAVPKTVMIDVSRHAPLVRACLRKYLKAHRTATSLRSKKGGQATKGAV